MNGFIWLFLFVFCFLQDEKSLPKDFGPPDRAAAAAAALPRKCTCSFPPGIKKKSLRASPVILVPKNSNTGVMSVFIQFISTVTFYV